MVIGNSGRPCCFNKKTGQEMGFHYHNGKKAWMTAALLFDWFERFNRFIDYSVCHKVLLFIEYCSAHVTKETVVQIEFLPPNTTSKTQPCDASTVTKNKCGFRKL